MKTVTKLSYISHFQKIFSVVFLHSLFSENIYNYNLHLFAEKTLTIFFVMKALTNHDTLVFMQITMKACFHCIDIMLEIFQV